MYISAPTLDDLLRQVFERLLLGTNHINPSRGEATELTGILLEVQNPRARLSRTETRGQLFSCLGELLWYLAKTNGLGFIKYYLKPYQEDSEDNQTIYGGYGPRLFDMRGHDQVANVLTLLRRNTESRRAVIQLFDAADISRQRKEIPCTCTLQFMIRRGRLHLFTNMRSNDVFLGLPHDVFAFTMIQEVMARSLGVKLGRYKHAVGSLHLYDIKREKAQRYLDEGYQSTVFMPAMPVGDPWPSITILLEAESAIRSGRDLQISDLELDPYWADLVRLLQILAKYKSRDREEIERLKDEMFSDVYRTYIDKKRIMKKVDEKTSEQLLLIRD